MKFKGNRTASFIVVAAIYAAAFIFGFLIFKWIDAGWILRLLAADVAATLLVFFCSIPLDNDSVYDPYWSVAPVVILPLCITKFGVWNPGSAVLLACIVYWGVRLTANWAYTFRDLNHQDWRYTWLQQESGAWYPLVSLLGTMLFPTLVVFLCMLPAFLYIQTGAINAGTLIGFAVCLLATTLQLLPMRNCTVFSAMHADARESSAPGSGNIRGIQII